MTPPPTRIRVAGLGLLSPLGLGAWPTFGALMAGQTLGDRAANLPDGLDPVSFCQSLGRVAVTPHAGDDPAVELAERAARQAATEAGVSLESMRCCIGTSKGAIGAMAFSRDAERSASCAESALRAPLRVAAKRALGAHGYLTASLRQRLNLGLTEHYVAACASSLTALHHARLKMLQPNGPDAMLVVTSEATLLPMFIHSYRRLGVLAPFTATGYATGPLDESRRGFFLSELAAAVVLQRADSPQPGQLELTDTAIAADAYDLIRTDPDMPALRHIASQLLTGEMVIHPHATGTAEHDPAEMAVFMADGRWPMADCYAVKGALGHGLGASGLVSFVIACLCARTNQRPPMPWLTRPIAPHLKPQASSLKPNTPHAVFAAGFAGHTAGAVVRRV